MAYGSRKREVDVVHEVSFSIGKGETLALVGESGSGKSTIGKAIVGLTPVKSGSISLGGREITHMRGKARRLLASELQMIFQNPYGSLNPAMTVGSTLVEPLVAAGGLSRAEAGDRVAQLLHRVNLPADAAHRRPAAFSGGQRQRIAIARAVALQPSLIVCDEPTSALDVSTQAAVLDLLAELQKDLGVSYLFISHDLAVVRRFASRVMVLERGRVVEEGSTAKICTAPSHPYTAALVAAAPVPDPRIQRMRRESRLAERAGVVK
ncbi:ATP-binding cassette domain-containing protein [Pseudarthrobacter sp. NPDC089323]